jgi:ABC-type glycerol-3-phosphate transport system substrate-binding protein
MLFNCATGLKYPLPPVTRTLDRHQPIDNAKLFAGTRFDLRVEATGVDVKYSSSENYEQQIVIDTQAGSPPDVAILPQPGLIADLAAKGLLTPLGDETKQWLLDNYAAGQSWVDLSTYNGKDGTAALYAFPDFEAGDAGPRREEETVWRCGSSWWACP